MVVVSDQGEMWFFDGARCKKALSSLKTMQRKAAIWITGAFSTFPTGEVESPAGLIPVHLHLQKMAGRANYQAATLSDSHPLQSILGQDHHRGAQAHPCAISKMSEAFKQKVKGTVMEIDRRLPSPRHGISILTRSASLSARNPGGMTSALNP